MSSVTKRDQGMRNCLILCVALFAIAGTAFGEGKKPPTELVVDLGGGMKMEMVLIPAGFFMMGDANGEDNEKPIHKVNITKSFYLGKYEVTQEQWEAVMGNNPSRFTGPKLPVEQVTWYGCQAFLGKLNAKTGGRGGKFQLPTEAQWEYACRAGSTTKYCFGDDVTRLGDYAWYLANSEMKTHPVGEKKPNAFGLYDMHGNVWEWCADWHDGDYYAKSPADDPTGPPEGLFRAYRGGGWFDGVGHCRAAGRNLNVPEFRGGGLGLRVARVTAE